MKNLALSKTFNFSLILNPCNTIPVSLDGLFDEWINEQMPSPKWTPLILPEDTLAEDLLSGNASPAIQTPVANSGNITPDDDNQALDRGSADLRPQVGEENVNEHNNIRDNLGEGISTAVHTTINSGTNPSLPFQPGSRGGHQMVIDSASQVCI